MFLETAIIWEYCEGYCCMALTVKMSMITRGLVTRSLLVSVMALSLTSCWKDMSLVVDFTLHYRYYAILPANRSNLCCESHGCSSRGLCNLDRPGCHRVSGSLCLGEPEHQNQNFFPEAVFAGTWKDTSTCLVWVQVSRGYMTQIRPPSAWKFRVDDWPCWPKALTTVRLDQLSRSLHITSLSD